MLNKVKCRKAEKKIILLLCICISVANIFAQQIPGVIITPQSTPPIKVYEKPQIKKQIIMPLEPKQTPLPNINFATFITTMEWKGARTWNDAQFGYVDSVTSIVFDSKGGCTWVKQGWEYVTRTTGNYSITGNAIEINFNYKPYSHKLIGAFDPVTKKITGKFEEVKAKDNNAPTTYPGSGLPYTYVPGLIEGQFNFFIK
jgi:hypothetical protein